MSDALSRLRNIVWDNLGSCMTCVRTAFQAAAAAWSFVALSAFFDWSSILFPANIGAIALTVLWGAHLFVHARKVAISTERHNLISLPIRPAKAQAGPVSRRRMLSVFWGAVFSGAVVSATPTFAAINCSAGTGSCEQDNCPQCSRPCYTRGNTLPQCVKCYGCPGNCSQYQQC
jgi:hypothetical protein